MILFVIMNLKLHDVQGPGCQNCCQLFASPHRHSRSGRDEGDSRGNVPWNVFKVYKVLVSPSRVCSVRLHYITCIHIWTMQSHVATLPPTAHTFCMCTINYAISGTLGLAHQQLYNCGQAQMTCMIYKDRMYITFCILVTLMQYGHVHLCHHTYMQIQSLHM